MKCLNFNKLLTAVVLLVCAFACSLDGYCQSTKDQNLRVIFIDHEPSTPSSEIISYIRKLRTQALENGNVVIFYMPNDQNPFVAYVNANDPEHVRDTQTAFDRICEALNLPSHNKEPWFDRKTMAQLVLRDVPILDGSRNINFASVRMEFYLSSEFWKLGYNESIIAPLFFALNVPDLLKKEFNFDVYINPADKPSYDEGMAFGKKNYDNINKLVSLYDYDF